MKFIITVVDTQTRSPHTPEEIAAIDAFNEKLIQAKQRVLAVGLESPEEALVIDARKPEVTHTSGLLNNSTEFASGVWIIDVPNRQIAIELAEEGSKACNRKVELRPVIG